jgi:hypothetical protein
LLFSALGFYIFAREFESIYSNTRLEIRAKSWLLILTSSVLVGFATASYHSTALLFMIGVFSWVVLGNRANSKNFIFTFAGSVTFLFGLAFWAIVGFLAKLTFGVPLAPEYSYIQGYWKPDVFWSNPLNSLVSLFNEVFMHYSVNEVLYGRSAGLVFVIVVSGLILLLVSRGPSLFSQVTAYLGLLITPFAFSFVSGPSGVPIRSLVTIGFVIAVIVLFILRTKNEIVAFAITAVAVMSFIQLNQVTSEYAAEERVAFNWNASLASEIYWRLDDCGLPLGEEKIIAISGYRQFSTPYATAFGSVSDASFFGFYGPSPGRAALFMRILGYDNSLITTSSDLLSVYSGEIASMPIFPEEGSIACFGNINVVKLSD